ncbi:MAG: integral rane sensor signal transduction histidine kinase [Hydrocarboniphaga sp.]|nr:integral rane sensor signal transduction histidine kinase [Hydrocarboniphaga sp.]
MTFSILAVYVPLALLKRGGASSLEWVLTAAAMLAFIGLNAAAVACWQRQRPFRWVPGLLVVIGFPLASGNAAALIFFTFAATILPWAENGATTCTAKSLALLIAVEWLRAWTAPAEIAALWWIDVPIFSAVNAAGSLWVVRMTLGIRQLGHAAARERIASELTAVLDGALIHIVGESERAQRSMARPDDARRHVDQIQAIARRALAEVRARIRDYRAEAPGSDDKRAELSATAPINWWPMIFAIYIVYLPLGFQRSGGGSAIEWLAVDLGVAAFVALLAIAVVFWQRRRPFLWVVGALPLLGALFAERVPTAALFFTFAAALVPWAVNGDIRRTLSFVALLIAAELLTGLWLASRLPAQATGLKAWWWATIPIFTAIEAAGYLWAVRMSLRHLALAKAAERERIARDLHDVIGHTLSLIALKSELAGRLLVEHPDIPRAQAEITDIQQVSRHALAEVLSTILGERVETLERELERAAGVALDCRQEVLNLGSAQQGIIGLALREAVTNVVRHAQARRCSIRLQQEHDLCVLEVQDDGCGGGVEGSGLQGMRERIEALGGSVLREMPAGTRLTVRLPVLPLSP